MPISNPTTSRTVARWVKITKTYADFAAAGLTNDIEIYSLPAKGVIHAVQINPTTTFSGGLISAYTLSVGIATNLVKYQAAAVVFTGATLPAVTATTGVESMLSATSIRGAAISITGLLNAATQGVVNFYLLVSNLE